MSAADPRTPLSLHHPSRPWPQPVDSHRQATLQLKTPYRDGTTHVVMTPLEFLQRLAALVPRPRLHLIRFHGVLAPNSALRAQIVPEKPDHSTVPAQDHTDEPPSSAQRRLSWALLLKQVFEIDMTTCSVCGGPLSIIAAPSASSGQAS